MLAKTGKWVKRADSPIPLYHRLELDLIARIDAGEFPAPNPLPTEEQIGLHYGVSRITVRKALDALTKQGRIVRRRGVGSFVAERPGDVHSIHLTGSLDDFLRAADQTTPHVLSVETVAACETAAEIFGVRKKSPILRIELISFGRDGPIAHCEFLFPQMLIGKITREAIINDGPVMNIVERVAGVRVARVSQIIEPTLSNETVSASLGISGGTPILMTRRAYYTDSGRPVEIAFVHLHPTRYRYEVELLARPPG